MDHGLARVKRTTSFYQSSISADREMLARNTEVHGLRQVNHELEYQVHGL